MQAVRRIMKIIEYLHLRLDKAVLQTTPNYFNSFLHIVGMHHRYIV